MKYLIEFEIDIDLEKEGIGSQCDLEHTAVKRIQDTIDTAVNIDDLYDKTKFNIVEAE